MLIRVLILVCALFLEEEIAEAQAPSSLCCATVEITAGGKLQVQASEGFHNLMLTYMLYNMFRRALELCVRDCIQNNINPKIYFDFTIDEAFKECIQDFIDESFVKSDFDGDPGFAGQGEEAILAEPMYDVAMTTGARGSGYTIEQELSVPD